MQPLVTQRWLTTQADETRALGVRLGERARAGDFVACCGALGAGKTTFVQGFAVHMYHGLTPLYHFDFYRLSCFTEVQDIGFEEYLDARGVVIVEWADKFPQLLPAERLEVYIRIAASGSRWVQWMAYDMFYGRYFLHAD